jgi:hypothetical protein
MVSKHLKEFSVLLPELPMLRKPSHAEGRINLIV